MKSDHIVMMITLIVSLIALAMSFVNFMDAQEFWSRSMQSNSVRTVRSKPSSSNHDAMLTAMIDGMRDTGSTTTPTDNNTGMVDPAGTEGTTEPDTTPTMEGAPAPTKTVKQVAVVEDKAPPVEPEKYKVSLEYLNKFEERVNILKMKADQAKSLLEKGIASDWKLWLDRLQYDQGRLALIRLKSGKRPNPTYVETLLQFKLQDKMMEPQRAMEAKGVVGIDNIELRLKLNELEITMMDQMSRMTKEDMEKALSVVRKYPASPLSDRSLKLLINLEPAPVEEPVPDNIQKMIPLIKRYIQSGI